jgi:hypothetical protein
MKARNNDFSMERQLKHLQTTVFESIVSIYSTDRNKMTVQQAEGRWGSDVQSLTLQR